ncbi:MAG: 3-dehydroquinate synthase, partial [Pseudomonadota bacterium]
MKTLDVKLGERSYPITIGSGLLARGELLTRHIVGTRVAIVTNATVAPLYLSKVRAHLE